MGGQTPEEDIVPEIQVAGIIRRVPGKAVVGDRQVMVCRSPLRAKREQTSERGERVNPDQPSCLPGKPAFQPEDMVREPQRSTVIEESVSHPIALAARFHAVHIIQTGAKKAGALGCRLEIGFG